MTLEKNSFILYSNYYDILKSIPDCDLGQLFRAILAYQNGIETKLPNNIALAFAFIKNQLDIDKEKYETKIEKLKSNGKKGGLAKAKNSENENDVLANLAIAKFAKHNDNVNVNVNDNDLSLNGEIEKNSDEMRETSQKKEESSDRDREIPNNKGREIFKDMSDIFKNRIEISKEDREIVEKYVKKNKLATKNVRAYVNKIIENGGHIRIIAECLANSPPKKKGHNLYG